MGNIVLDKENVKLIGRTYLNKEGTLWCALSGTGAEFIFTGTRLSITFVADTVPATGNSENFCRFAVYCDGDRVVDELLDAQEKTINIIDSDTEVTKRVRIIKLSECAMSCVGIRPLEVQGTVSPAPAAVHRMEVIGDSITCGYGVGDENELHHFKTATEDVTVAYAYKTAKALGVDYSLYSTSGWGIISGYTDDGEPHREQRIPPYYETLGFTFGSFGEEMPQEIPWDFSAYVPELIVINLGTNDDSYCQDDEDRQREYMDEYKVFLKTVRSHNPDAHILCILGIMGTRLCPCIEKLVGEYTAETGDGNISTLFFEDQDPAVDGYAADFHPTCSTHNKMSAKLTAHIRELMGW